MTRTARICSRTIRIGHFSSRTIEGGTPTQLAEYFVKHLSFVRGLSSQHNKCTSYAHTQALALSFSLLNQIYAFSNDFWLIAEITIPICNFFNN